MAFDMSQVQRGARNRRTPYHEAARKYDPKGYTVYNHMYFPIRFDTFEAEFDALLNGVAHQFGIILEVQFLQNTGAVGTHRGRAEMHAFGDLRDGLP